MGDNARKIVHWQEKLHEKLCENEGIFVQETNIICCPFRVERGQCIPESLINTGVGSGSNPVRAATSLCERMLFESSPRKSLANVRAPCAFSCRSTDVLCRNSLDQPFLGESPVVAPNYPIISCVFSLPAEPVFSAHISAKD